jgi:hypothetical protein
MAMFRIFAVQGGAQGFSLALGGCRGCPVAARVLHAPSPVVFTLTADPAFGVFLLLTDCI